MVVIFKINIFVLKAGANPGVKDKAGRHSLHWAAHHGHAKCLKSLLNSKSAESNLQWMMADRDNVIIRTAQCVLAEKFDHFSYFFLPMHMHNTAEIFFTIHKYYS